MKYRRYEALKRELKLKDIDQQYLAGKIGRSTYYVSQRMNGAKPWTAADMYTIMELINCPVDKLHIMFPKDGIAPKGAPLPADSFPMAGRVFKIVEVSAQ